MIPELTAVRASSSCAAFPLWNRHCMGQGGQVPAQPGLDSSLTRSKQTVLGGRLPEMSPTTALCQNPDVQNREITICQAANEFHKPSCENLLKFHNTLHLQKNSEQRLNIFFLQHPSKPFSIGYDQLAWSTLLQWEYITQWCQIQSVWKGLKRLSHPPGRESWCHSWHLLQKAEPILPFKFQNCWTQSWEAISQDLLICKKYNCLFSKGKINWDLYFPDYKQHAAFLLNSLQNVQMFQYQHRNLLKS